MKSFKNLALAVLVAFIATFVVVPTSAQAQVTNGGAETGDFTGWTVDNGTCGRDLAATTEMYVYNSSQYTTHTGNNGFWFGATGCTGGMFQDIATVAGQPYSVSFWADVNALGMPNGLSVSFGDGSLNHQFTSDNNGATWHQFTFTGTANSNSTRLQFMGQDDPSGIKVDDINVTTTPEPSSMALLGTGLVGLVPMARRRKLKNTLNSAS